MIPADPAFLEWRTQPSTETLRRLLRANQDRVYSLCFQVLRHVQDAEDAAQASLLEIARGVGSIAEPGAFSSWLYRVCLNNALNLRRSRRRRKAREERSAAMTPTADLQSQEDIRDAVHDALARLDDDERTLVVEHYFEKLTLDDLGSRRGLSGVAMWKRLEHAKEKMKRSLAGAGFAIAGSELAAILDAAQFTPAPPGFSVEPPPAPTGPPTAPAAKVIAGAGLVVAAAIVTAILLRPAPLQSATTSTVEAKEPKATVEPVVEAKSPVVEPIQEEVARVLGADGLPLQGVLVFPGRWYRLRGDDVFDPFRPHSIRDGVTTDAEGRFTLATNKPFITAWHPEYSPTTVKADDVKPLRLKPQGKIRGRLVDSDGKPLEGVEVMLDKRGPKVSTNAAGEFAFDHVNAGIRGLILPEARRIAVRVDPGETLNIDIGPGVDVELDLSAHPVNPASKDGFLVGTGRAWSLPRGAANRKGMIPGRYLYIETRSGPSGRVDISGPTAKVEFGTSSLEIQSPTPLEFYLIPPDCNEILEVALTKDPIHKAGPGNPVRISHLLEGEYEIRDPDGVTIQKFKVSGGETRIALKGR